MRWLPGEGGRHAAGHAHLPDSRRWLVQLCARCGLGRRNVQDQDRQGADAQQRADRLRTVRKVHGPMSKRKMEGGIEDAINMDVMMDNMTDVVGTLLLVLIIVQLKV